VKAKQDHQGNTGERQADVGFVSCANGFSIASNPKILSLHDKRHGSEQHQNGEKRLCPSPKRRTR
jgi:hypothetical protein